MAIRAKKQGSWFIILIIAVAVVTWALEQRTEQAGEKSGTSRKETAPGESRRPAPKPSPSSGSTSRQSLQAGAAERKGRYEVFRNCTLAADKTNDGDSFRVTLPDRRREIFRLYFVDTPESDFKTYRNGEDNHDRIREQAAYFGITPEEAVKIGKDGKHFVTELLSRRPFTLYTEWDSPFRDQRYHAFVEVEESGRPQWLHEILMRKGLVRLKTKPADLPDGTKVDAHRRHLEKMQADARKAGAGGWKGNRPAGVR